MILEGCVYCPALVIDVAHLRVSLEDVLFLLGWRPLWGGFRSSWVGREEKGGSFKESILMFWKDHPEVSGLASTKNNLDKCHVCLQALMDLLDCGVFGLDRMLG